MEEQYIVVPRSDTVEGGASLLQFMKFVEFVESVTDNPIISIESVSGDTSSPRRIIISANSSVIEGLRSLYGNQFIIEKDEEIAPPGPLGSIP